MKFIFAISHAAGIRAVLDQGDGALAAALERWEPDERKMVARALAKIG